LSRLKTATLVRSPNLHRAVVNFRHFHFEQALHQGRVGARNDDLRPLGGAIHHADHDAKPLADVVGFKLGLLALGQAGFGAAHVHDQIRTFGALDDDRDQFADAVVVLVKNGVALGFAHLLQNHLLGGLRRDAAEHFGRLGRAYFGAHFGRGILAARVAKADFACGIGHFLDHGQHGKHIHLARFLVELAAQVFLGFVIFAGRDDHGVFDGGHDHVRLNMLFAAEHFDLLIEKIRHNMFPKTSFTISASGRKSGRKIRRYNRASAPKNRARPLQQRR